MGKYQRLGEYLTAQKGDCCTLPFIKIEEIIGGSLPRSARNHREWWANDGRELGIRPAPRLAGFGQADNRFAQSIHQPFQVRHAFAECPDLAA